MRLAEAMIFEQRVKQALSRRQEQGLLRHTEIFRQGQLLTHSHLEQPLVNFSSNDYLGLAQDKELISVWQQGLSLYGCGSGASPVVTGTTQAHADLKARLCEWLGYPSAILLSSGFSANQALIFTLLKQGDLLLQDKLNHASLIEAGLLSPTEMVRFKHNDLDDLHKKLTKVSTKQVAKLIISEGVFSMDGDQAPVLQLMTLAQSQQAWLALDDAHGLGVLGEFGGGTVEVTGIKPTLLVVTFGKALGISGAAILCDQATGEYLTQFARHYVYSTAMPPAQAYALNHSINMVQQQKWRREKLAELSAYFQDKVGKMPHYRATQTTIKPWICGRSEDALALSDELKQQDLWVGAIRPPTVTANAARLRITLNATHSKHDIERLSQALQRFYGERGNSQLIASQQEKAHG